LARRVWYTTEDSHISDRTLQKRLFILRLSFFDDEALILRVLILVILLLLLDLIGLFSLRFLLELVFILCILLALFVENIIKSLL